MPKSLPNDRDERALAGPAKDKGSETHTHHKPVLKHPKKASKKHRPDHGPNNGHADQPHQNDLERAYCHLGRASVISSELETAQREFVAHFIEYGCGLYLDALAAKGKEARRAGLAAAEMLRAAEHIAFSGLYARNRQAVPSAIPPPKIEVARQSKELARIIDKAGRHATVTSPLGRFTAAARELLSHAKQASEMHETQLAHEFLHAADALAKALPGLQRE